MKLSEAIRAGAKLRPQAISSLFANGGSCAIGAAFEAITGCVEMSFGASYACKAIGLDFCDFSEPFNCPKCRIADSFAGQITHLNDRHRWTRERIASWVAKVENGTVRPC